MIKNAVRVEVRRGKNESATSLIRRFTRRAQTLGIVRAMRKRRYYERQKSKNVDHRRALIKSEKRQKFAEDIKLGKIDPATFGKGKRK